MRNLDIELARNTSLDALHKRVAELEARLVAAYGEHFEDDFERGLVWDDDYALFNAYSDAVAAREYRRWLERQAWRRAS